jgi:hypothetical protein
MTGASPFNNHSLRSSRLTPILLWSYIAFRSNNAGSQRQYAQAFIFDIYRRVNVLTEPID